MLPSGGKLSKHGKFTGSKPEQISTVEDLVEWYGPKATPEKFEPSVTEAPVVSGVSLGVPWDERGVFDEEVGCDSSRQKSDF